MGGAADTFVTTGNFVAVARLAAVLFSLSPATFPDGEYVAVPKAVIMGALLVAGMVLAALALAFADTGVTAVPLVSRA